MSSLFTLVKRIIYKIFKKSNENFTILGSKIKLNADAMSRSVGQPISCIIDWNQSNCNFNQL